MLFLDLDLDFFLNKNVYYSGYDGTRPGPEYQPWHVSGVRRFLEGRCGLSPDKTLPGRTVATHDGVLEFWRTLIGSGRLGVPFAVVHIDAHPDLWVGDVLYLKADFLRFDVGRGTAALKQKQVHAGNYLTFAIAYGWIDSLVWVNLPRRSEEQPGWDADAMHSLFELKNKDSEHSNLPEERLVRFKILPWDRFRETQPFDYIALSKSPDFTPPESDKLIPLIERYMRQI
jgi:hypothetical protein